MDVQGEFLIGRRHGADDLSAGRLAQVLDRAGRRFAKDLTGFLSALGLEDGALAARIDRLGSRLELSQEAHHAVPGDVGRHRSCLRKRVPYGAPIVNSAAGKGRATIW